MKRLSILVMTIVMAFSTGYAQDKTSQKKDRNAQQEVRNEKKSTVKEQQERRKEREELRKMAAKDLNARVDNTVAKEAKRLEKEGWRVRPGALPLEKQLERSYTMQYEYDEDLYPKYIMGEATSVGENYDAAKTSAMSLALNNLAGQIQSEVTALIENTVVNKQLTAQEAISISETVMSSKMLISQSLGRTLPVMECFRENSKKNTEVLVRVAYSGEKAKKAAADAVRKQLEEKGEKLSEQLDKILGL